MNEHTWVEVKRRGALDPGYDLVVYGCRRCSARTDDPQDIAGNGECKTIEERLAEDE